MDHLCADFQKCDFFCYPQHDEVTPNEIKALRESNEPATDQEKELSKRYWIHTLHWYSIQCRHLWALTGFISLNFHCLLTPLILSLSPLPFYSKRGLGLDRLICPKSYKLLLLSGEKLDLNWVSLIPEPTTILDFPCTKETRI